jgi:parallel beta-helix repeat protein
VIQGRVTANKITQYTEINGLTIKGDSYGIYSNTSSDQLVIKNNTVSGSSYGIYALSSQARIGGNDVTGGYYGIAAVRSNVTIENNMIHGCRYAGVLNSLSSAPTIRNNIFYANDAIYGGVYAASSSPVVAGNTFVGGAAGVRAAGTSARPIIIDNIFTLTAQNILLLSGAATYSDSGNVSDPAGAFGINPPSTLVSQDPSAAGKCYAPVTMPVLSSDMAKAIKATASAAEQIDPMASVTTQTVKSGFRYMNIQTGLATSWHERAVTISGGATDKVTETDIEATYDTTGRMETYYARINERSLADNGVSLNKSSQFCKYNIIYDKVTGQTTEWTQRTFADTSSPDLITESVITATYNDKMQMVTYYETGAKRNIVPGNLNDAARIEELKTASLDALGGGDSLAITYTMDRTLMTYNALNQMTAWREVTSSSDALDKETRSDVRGVYDAAGQLARKIENVTEIDKTDPARLNHSYSIVTDMSYNAQGQMARMARAMTDGAKTTIEADTADRSYDIQGRLVHSMTSTTEKDPTGEALDHTFTTESTMTAYNSLGQVLAMNRVMIDDAKVTREVDVAARQYDVQGRLLYSLTASTNDTYDFRYGIAIGAGTADAAGDA